MHRAEIMQSFFVFVFLMKDVDPNRLKIFVIDSRFFKKIRT